MRRSVESEAWTGRLPDNVPLPRATAAARGNGLAGALLVMGAILAMWVA